MSAPQARFTVGTVWMSYQDLIRECSTVASTVLLLQDRFEFASNSSKNRDHDSILLSAEQLQGAASSVVLHCALSQVRGPFCAGRRDPLKERV